MGINLNPFDSSSPFNPFRTLNPETAIIADLTGWEGLTSPGLNPLLQYESLKHDWTKFKHWLVPDMRQDREITTTTPNTARRLIYGTAKVGGQLVWAETTGDDNQYLHLIIVLSGREVSSVGDVYFDDTLATDSRFSGLTRITKYDGSQTTADADTVADCTTWTADHKLQGCAYLAIRLTWDETAFPAGIPNISAVVQGHELYDPRTTLTAYSDNPALVLYDYLTLSESEGGMGCTASEIDSTAIETAADACDVLVASDTTGGTEKRFTCNGVVSLESSAQEITGQLLTSMAGSMVWAGGVWTIRAGVAETSSHSIDESWLNGGVSFTTASSKGSKVNTVKATYLAADQDYQQIAAPILTSSSYIAADGDEELALSMALPFTTSSAAAQRLAKLAMEKSRYGVTCSMVCNLKALAVSPGDVVAVTIDRLGWSAKEFRVSSWGFSTAGIELELTEENSAIYSWGIGDVIEVSPPAATVLPSPWIVSTPTGLTSTESATVSTDGTALVDVEITWDAPPSSSVSHHELEVSPNGTDGWMGFLATGTKYRFNGVAPGATWYFRLRAVNALNAKSDWATDNVYVDGITDTPAAPISLTVTETVDTISAEWTYAADDDFRKGTELWAVDGDTYGNDRTNAFKVDTVLGQRVSYQVDAATSPTWYVWVRAIDNVGNTSDWYPASATGGIPATPASAAGLTQAQLDAIADANDLIAAIADDDKISTVEKKMYQQTWNNLVAEYDKLLTKKTEITPAVDTEWTAFDSSATALYTYMTTTIGFTDLTTDTDLTDEGTSRTEFENYWEDYFYKRQLLINAIESYAAGTAVYSNITGTKPPSDADNTASAVGSVSVSSFPTGIQNGQITVNADGSLNNAGGGAVTLSGLGAGLMAGLNEINASNFLTYIKYLSADVITAGTLTGLKFRTAESGARAELHSASGGQTHALTFYNSAGTLIGYLTGSASYLSQLSCGTLSVATAALLPSVNMQNNSINSANAIGCATLTATGEVQAGQLDINGNADISGTLDLHSTLDMNSNYIGSCSGIDVAGEARCNSLRIDQTPSTGSGLANFTNGKPSAATTSNQWLSISLNGTTYYIPCWT